MKKIFVKALVISALLEDGMLIHAVNTITVFILHFLFGTMAIFERTLKDVLIKLNMVKIYLFHSYY